MPLDLVALQTASDSDFIGLFTDCIAILTAAELDTIITIPRSLSEPSGSL